MTGDRLQERTNRVHPKKAKRKSDRVAMLLTPPSSRSTPKRPSLASPPAPPSSLFRKPTERRQGTATPPLPSPKPGRPKRQGKVKLPFLPHSGTGRGSGSSREPSTSLPVPYAGPELRSHPSLRLTRQLRSNRRHRTGPRAQLQPLHRCFQFPPPAACRRSSGAEEESLPPVTDALRAGD